MADDFIGSITELVTPILEEEGLELVEVEYKRGARRSFLRIYIDKPGGVTIDDCSNVSGQLGDLLDIEDLIHNRYVLEVSSPGANRPLKSPDDYKRFLGRLARVTTVEPVAGKQRHVGRLVAFDQGKVTLDVQNSGPVTIELTNIERARLEVEL
jgi:ribosome maturation factor RimP